MSKIDLDSTNMKSRFSININDTISALEKVLRIYDSTEVPNDFFKNQELKNIMNSIKTIKNELDHIYNNVTGSNSNYNTLISNLKDQANKMPNFSIKERNTLI